MYCCSLFKTFFTVSQILYIQDEGCSRHKKALLSFIPGMRAYKAQALSSPSVIRVWTTGQQTQVRVCSSVWSFHAVFANPRKTQRHPHHVSSPLFQRKKCTYLWSWQQSPENRFSSLFLINLWTKTRDSDILQRRLRKSITRLGGAFHQYHMRISQCSHVKLAKRFCFSTAALTAES